MHVDQPHLSKHGREQYLNHLLVHIYTPSISPRHLLLTTLLLRISKRSAPSVWCELARTHFQNQFVDYCIGLTDNRSWNARNTKQCDFVLRSSDSCRCYLIIPSLTQRISQVYKPPISTWSRISHSLPHMRTIKHAWREYHVSVPAETITIKAPRPCLDFRHLVLPKHLRSHL